MEESKRVDVTILEPTSSQKVEPRAERESVVDVVKEMVADLTSEAKSKKSLLAASRDVVRKKSPRLKEAVKFSSADIVQWINKGGVWRAFLITVTGLITLVGLTGVAAFLVFFIFATANTVVVALLGSVAAVGACVALFFAALTAVYISALSVAVFVISSIAFMSIFAIAIAAGWIAVLWGVWKGFKTGLDLFRGSMAVTASTLQTVSSAGQTKGQTRIAVIDGKPHALTLS